MFGRVRPASMPADLERQPLADELLRALDVAQVELREGAEGPHPGDLHLGAALVDGRHQPLDRDARLEGLAQLVGDVLAAGGLAPQHQAAGLRVGAGDRGLELVPDIDGESAGRVLELGDVDHPFGLAAEVDEGRRLADREDAALDLPAHRGLRRRGLAALLLAVLLLELRQDLAEVLAFLDFLLLHSLAPAYRSCARLPGPRIVNRPKVSCRGAEGFNPRGTRFDSHPARSGLGNGFRVAARSASRREGTS